MKPTEVVGDSAIRGDSMLQRIPVLVYHKIDYKFEFSITRIPPHRFVSHLDWLQYHDYNTITISEAERIIRGNLVFPAKTVAIVFDDGFENFYTYAYPLLKDRGMIATVYMITGYAGMNHDWDVNIGWRKFRHLSWSQIEDLADDGFEFGSHTVNHPDLTRLSEHRIIYELTDSRSKLEDRLGRPVKSFSYPFGGYSERIKLKVIEAGYSSAVLVRNKFQDSIDKRLITLCGTCVYQTTRIKRLANILSFQTPSPFQKLVQRGIGWCASKTPVVKSPPPRSDTR